MFPVRALMVKSVFLLGLCAALVGCPTPEQQLQLLVTPDELEFGASDTPQTLSLRTNMATNTPPHFVANVEEGAAEWLSVDPPEGDALGPNSNQKLTVQVNRSGLRAGYNVGVITIESAGLVPRKIVVTADTLVAADFAGAPKEIFQGESVVFQNKSAVATGQSALTTWHWDFGDGSTSTVKDPTHTYTAAGLKTVTLTVGRSGQPAVDVETKVDYINVQQKLAPVAAFTMTTVPPPATPPPVPPDTLEIQAGQTVQFTNASVEGTQPITSYLWDFGDGQTSTAVSPTHTYANGGYYTVSLTVTSLHGTDTETKVNAIFVKQEPPQASFTFPGGTLLANTSIAFTDTSVALTAPIVSWGWDFGDGTQGYGQHATHVFANGGDFPVTLTVASAHGSTSVTQMVHITQTAPTANFTASTVTPIINELVTFTDTSTPGTASIAAYEWNFGDGTALGTAKNPTHKYTTEGTFTVTLKVTSAHGTHSVTKTNFITTHRAAPVASFTATPTQTYDGRTVQFTDTSVPNSSEITSWLWNFGDGQTSADQHPTHVYAAAGTYTVTLKVVTADGENTGTRANYINVQPKVLPAAAFTVSKQDPFEADSVSFTDQSTPGTGTITAWLWEFGDGEQSTEQHPTHIYNTAGTFTVSLTVTTIDGSNKLTKTGYMTVQANVDPTADFTADDTTPAAKTPVTFTDTSQAGSSPIISYQWDFGDAFAPAGGNVSSERNPSHAYSKPGLYTVKLTVVTAHGTHTVTKTDYVDVGPFVDFTVSDISPDISQTVTFTDTTLVGAVPIVSWLWEFGDGTMGFQQNPMHQYGRQASFDVKLTITLANGFVTSTTKTAFITVGAAGPTAAFIASNYAPFLHEQVTFTDQSTAGSAPITAWAWNFGDGTTSAAPSPNHTYTTGGSFIVTLTVTTRFGSHTAPSRTIVVSLPPAPEVDFTIDKKVAYRGVDNITFTSTSWAPSGTYTMYYHWYAWKVGTDPALTASGIRNWLGGGKVLTVGPSFEGSVAYPFQEAGMYSVRLTVWLSSVTWPGDPNDPFADYGEVSNSIVRENIIEIREPSPLDRFVHSDSTTYQGTLQNTITGTADGIGYKAYVINLVSQAWNAYGGGPTPANWRHWLTIVQPNNLTKKTALMYLTGGLRTDPPPNAVDTALAQFAVRTGSVVAIMTGLPNLPLDYSEYDETMIDENRLMAATLDDYMSEPGSATLGTSKLLVFPMVKATVRGMNAVQNFLADPIQSGNVPPLRIDDFVLAGGSENGLTRGWTTWLSATTDERVRGIIPISFDFLNMGDQLRHQYESLGNYSEALWDYWAPWPIGFDVLDPIVYTDPETGYSGGTTPQTVHRYRLFLERIQRLILLDGINGITVDEDPEEERTRLEELFYLLDGDEDAETPPQDPTTPRNVYALTQYMQDLYFAGYGEAETAAVLSMQLWEFVAELIKTPPPGDQLAALQHSLAGNRYDLYHGQIGNLIEAMRVMEEQIQNHHRISLIHYVLDPMFQAYPFAQAVRWYSPYGGRLGMPKYIINSTGSSYTMTDAADWYYGDLSGSTHLRYYPNTDQTLTGSFPNVVLDAIPWYNSVATSTALPKFGWTVDEQGLATLSFPANTTLPSSITLWAATNANGLDFRHDPLLNPTPPNWVGTAIPVRQGSITMQVYPGLTETTAFYLEMKYGISGGTFTACTPVKLVPPYDTPFKSRRPSFQILGGEIQEIPTE